MVPPRDGIRGLVQKPAVPSRRFFRPYWWIASLNAIAAMTTVNGHWFLPGGGQQNCPAVAIRTAQ